MEVSPSPRPLNGTASYGAYIEYLPEMARRSKVAMETEAFSYRGFNVGSTLMAENSLTGEDLLITSGNCKITPVMSKHCAEMFVLDEMDACNNVLAEQSARDGVDYGFYRPIGLVTVATANKKLIRDVTHKPTPTLHMCSDCVAYYRSHELVNEAGLLNTTLPDDMRYMEVHSVREYRRMPTGIFSAFALRSIIRLLNSDDWHRDQVRHFEELASQYEGRSFKSPLLSARLAQKALLGLRKSSAPQATASTRPRLVVPQTVLS